MRREDELLQMVQGRDPMAGAGPPMPGQGPPMEGPPMDQMMPMEPPMDQMEPPMDDMLDQSLPQTGRVADIKGGTVHVIDENGTELQVPIDGFPFPPEVGMELVRAEVMSIEGDTMTAQLSTTGETVTLPMEMLKADFNQGEFFWMPAPPEAPPEESEFEQILDEPLL